jgi:hypothetical protein
MKIGFSFGRCVRDIVKGDVAYDDVLVIIARTYMPDVDAIEDVIDQYLYEPSYLRGLDRDECLRVGRQLFTEAKLHQPRNYMGGMHWQSRVGSDYVWMDVVPTNAASDIPAVQEAWENYQLVLRLCNTVPNAEDAPRD